VPGRLTVLVADDHAPTRAGVRDALGDDGFAVVAEAAGADAAVELALCERPDVCLLDIHMPGGGIAAAARITEELPEIVPLEWRDEITRFRTLYAPRLDRGGQLLCDLSAGKPVGQIERVFQRRALGTQPAEIGGMGGIAFRHTVYDRHPAAHAAIGTCGACHA